MRPSTDQTLSSAFCGYRFPDDVIALAVRWYLRFRLPYADVAELLAERGVHVDASTSSTGCSASRHSTRKPPARIGTKFARNGLWMNLRQSDGRAVLRVRAIDDLVSDRCVRQSDARHRRRSPLSPARSGDHGVRRTTATTDKVPSIRRAGAGAPMVHHITGKAEQQQIERNHQHLKGRYQSMRGFKTLPCAQTICAGHDSSETSAMDSTGWA